MTNMAFPRMPESGTAGWKAAAASGEDRALSNGIGIEALRALANLAHLAGRKM